MQNLVAAFESQLAHKQFSAASATLQQLLSDYPDDPQLQILKGRLYYATGEVSEAETLFRSLLKAQLPAQLISQARQGLLVIETAEINARQAKIDALLKLAGGSSLAYLALLPVSSAQKDLAIAKLARVFRTDPYTARFKIPKLHPKIIRTGSLAEMQAYGEELQGYGLGTIWLSLNTISQIPIYNIEYFSQNQINQNGEPQLRAIANTDEIAFVPESVITRVEGILPTFGEVVVVDAKHKLARKEQILDRVHICDLHLQSYRLNGKQSDRGCILRFHDNHYRFEVGLQLPIKRSLQHIAPTVQEQWAELSKWLTQTIPKAKMISDFQSFAEMSMGYPEFLQTIEETHIKLDRLKPSLWDNCFQLYSTTTFTYPDLS